MATRVLLAARQLVGLVARHLAHPHEPQELDRVLAPVGSAQTLEDQRQLGVLSRR